VLGDRDRRDRGRLHFARQDRPILRGRNGKHKDFVSAPRILEEEPRFEVPGPKAVVLQEQAQLVHEHEALRKSVQRLRGGLSDQRKEGYPDAGRPTIRVWQYTGNGTSRMHNGLSVARAHARDSMPITSFFPRTARAASSRGSFER